MATWDWNDVPHEEHPLVGGPLLAQRAACLVPGMPQSGMEYDALLEKVSGLPALSLVEWSVSALVPEIFRLLRETGSQYGFVVEQGDNWAPAANYRKIYMGEATAAQIARDSAMDPTMAFVDDTNRCVLSSWWSDHTWMCLTPELFTRWIAEQKPDLTLWADDPVRLIPADFEDACVMARKRNQLWIDNS